MKTPDVLARVTVQMRAVLDRQTALSDDAFETDVALEEMRRRYALERVFWNEGGPVMVATVDDLVPGPSGNIPIRAHRPSGASGRPCIVYLHGGGFVVGNLDTHDRIMRTLAERTGSVVVGVDYSLSPEAKFPMAVRECAAVVQHLRAAGAALGIDGNHISLAGDSGGANLCLATTLYLRDEAPGQAIRCLILYYGMFGLRDSLSQRLFGGEWDGLARADLDYYLRCYTTGPLDLESPYLDCLSADLSAGVPPCYIAASGLDPLRDDSLALSALLQEADVPHRLRVFQGVLHGFLHHSRMLPEAGEALADGADFYCGLLAATAR
ncbi:alpha/beta hydrolase fold domain-containing protein [Pengzhenrongella frigida]|uniref:Steryl acetyl hydrolase n=1 Tax=Pengzhenrongella frigida TaxID=1259133 RepID=A0A4Q5N3U4_9MICO|nr:alpha/beta hydrolase fold domain-containing protein [Cellulomonas sp. HLT2-17]RYV51307.1 steryl acetyl hydrolase [Cellulomonas sp. HLT2-17]